MSQSIPASVKAALQFTGQNRKLPRYAGHITRGELQSLMRRLHQLMRMTVQLADIVDQIRLRAVLDDKTGCNNLRR